NMVTEIDRNYRKRGWAFRVPLLAISLLLFALAWREATVSGKIFSGWTWGFVVSVIAGLVMEAAYLRHYRCPKCNSKLGPPGIKAVEDSNEYVYACPQCSILWRTFSHPPEP